MAVVRRTKADLIAEIETLRDRVAALEARPGARDDALARLETRVLHALRSAAAVVVEIDAKGNLGYVSPTVGDVLGYTPDELSEGTGLARVHEDDRSALLDLYRELRAGGGGGRGVFRARHRAGHWVWLETVGGRHRTPAGEDYAVLFARDVTREHLADDVLRASEARYRSLAEHASDLISEVDEQGRLLFTTPNCLEILGYRPEELVGRTLIDNPLFENVHADDREAALSAHARGIRGDPTAEAEYRYRHADGSWRWLHSRARRYRTAAGGLRFVVISRDVTERVRDQQALRRSEERYRVLAETTHDLVVELDPEGRVVFISPNCTDLLGLAPEQMIGTQPFSLIHAEDVERAVHLFLNREPGRRQGPAPVRVRHADGGWRLFEGGGFDYPTADGRLHLVGVVRDVTEARRIEQERRRLEECMQQAQKLESLGVMAGGVAHDFNNLLTPILGDASLALMDLPQDSPLRPRLVKIVEAARRAAELTGQMLAYAGEETLRAELLDLSRLVAERGRLLASAVSRSARLEIELSDDLPPVEADSSQVSQVLMNLVINASEALGDRRGTIALRTGCLDADDRYLATRLLGDSLEAGRYAYLEVEDDGAGMDAATHARAFEPFFTTKFTGRGLGLAAVLGIVRGHRGAIDSESHPGRGTRFRVLLPVASRERVAPRTARPSSPRRESPRVAADGGTRARDRRGPPPRRP